MKGRPRKTGVTLAFDAGDDATPHRMAMARRDGIVVEMMEILLPSGQKTGYKHRIIQDPFETAFRRGFIDDGQRQAAQVFMSHLFKATKDGSLTMSLNGSIAGAGSRLVSDVKLESGKIIAMTPLPGDCREAWLNWTTQVLCGRAGVAKLGAEFYARKGRTHSERQNITCGIRVMKDCLTAIEGYLT